LKDVPKPAKLGKSREPIQPLGHVAGAHVHPTYYALNHFMPAGQVEQEMRFGFGLICLHGNTALEVAGCKFRNELLRQEISFKGSHVIGNPAIAIGIVAPEMLVRVNSHATLSITLGKNPGTTCSAKAQEPAVHRIVAPG